MTEGSFQQPIYKITLTQIIQTDVLVIGGGAAGIRAAGEVVGGMHGANRLGGNALAEVFVFGSLPGSLAAQFVQKSGKEFLFQKHQALREWKKMVDSLGETRKENLPEMETELRSIQGKCLGVIRHQGAMEWGWGRLQILKQTFAESDFRPLKSDWEILTFRFKTLMAEMIWQSALAREESRGANIREDFPERDDKNWLRHICIQKQKERMNVSLEPVRPGRTFGKSQETCPSKIHGRNHHETRSEPGILEPQN